MYSTSFCCWSNGKSCCSAKERGSYPTSVQIHTTRSQPLTLKNHGNQDKIRFKLVHKGNDAVNVLPALKINCSLLQSKIHDPWICCSSITCHIAINPFGNLRWRPISEPFNKYFWSALDSCPPSHQRKNGQNNTGFIQCLIVKGQLIIEPKIKQIKINQL